MLETDWLHAVPEVTDVQKLFLLNALRDEFPIVIAFDSQLRIAQTAPMRPLRMSMCTPNRFRRVLELSSILLHDR